MATRAEIKNNALNAFNKKFPDYATDLETFSNLMVNDENFRENVYKLTGNPESKKNGYFKDIWGIESIVEPTPEQPIAENTSVEVDITQPVQEPVTEQPAQSSAMLQDIITPVERKPVIAESTNVYNATLGTLPVLDKTKDYSSMSIEDLSKEFAPLQDEYNKAKSAFGAYKEEITPAFEKEKNKHAMQSSSFAKVRGGAYVPTNTFSMDEYGTRDENYQKLKTAESEAAIQLTSSPAYKEFSSRQVKDLEKKKQELQSFIDDEDDERLKERIKLQMSGTKEDKEKDLEYARKEANVEAQIAFIDKTIQALQAPTKEDNSWWLTNVYRGAVDNLGEMLGTIGDAFTGFSDVRNNLAVADALKKVASLGKEATPEAIDKALTKEEKDMLIQWEQMNETKQLVAPNMSVGYKVGEGFATSTGFMLDFFLTRGAANAVSAPAKKAVMNAFGKWLGSNAIKGSKVLSGAVRGTGNTVGWATDATLSTAARTPLMSSTYENITERMTEMDENGKPRSAMNALVLGLSDAFIENFGETSGEMINKLGNILLKQPLKKSFGTLLSKMGASGKGVKAFADEIKEFKKIIEKGGYHGYSEEFLEEVFGTILTEARGLTGLDPNDKQAWEEFWEPENLNVLLQTLAIPMAPGMVKGTIKGVKEYKRSLPVGENNASAVVPENSVQLPNNNLQTPMSATYDLGDGNVIQGRIIGDYTIEDGKLQGSPVFQHEENGQVVTTKLEERFFDRISFEQPQEQEQEPTNQTGTFNDYIDETESEETDMNEEISDADIDAMIDEFESQEIANEQAEGQTEEQTEGQADEETQTTETEVAEQVNTPIQEEQGQTEGQAGGQTAPVDMEPNNPMFEMIRQADNIGVPFTSVIEKQEKKLNKLKESLADNFNQENIKKVQEQMAIVEEYKRVYAEYQAANQPSAQATEQVAEQAPTQVQAVESEPVTIPNAETNVVEQPVVTAPEQSAEQAPEQTEAQPAEQTEAQPAEQTDEQPTEQQVESTQEEELPTEDPEDVKQVRNTLATNAVLTALDKAGVKVVRATQDMVDAVLEKDGVELNAKRKSAPETVSVTSEEAHLQTVISSADGAKILKNLDKLSTEYENSKNKEKTFIGNVANALGMKNTGSSQYATFECSNGSVVTIRLSNHNATVSNFDNNGELEGISIVVSPQKSNGITNDGKAHVVEYYYDAIKLRKADGNVLANIIDSIKQTLYSGEYKDTTGLAERQEVNEKTTFLRSADGTIYGWVENGTIHLTEDGLNPNTPIHEYTHLWARCVKSLYPEKWNQITNTLKECKELWDAVVNDPAYEDIKDDDDAIASEVIARYSGEFGEQRMLEAVASSVKKDSDSIITKAKKALNEFWSQVKRIFYSLGTKDFGRSDFSDIEKISSTILRDLLLGKNPNAITYNAIKSANPMKFAIQYTGIKSLGNRASFFADVIDYPKPIVQMTSNDYVEYVRGLLHKGELINSCIDALSKELESVSDVETKQRITDVINTISDKYRLIDYNVKDNIRRGRVNKSDFVQEQQVVQEPAVEYGQVQDVEQVEPETIEVAEGEPSTDKKTKGLRLGRFDAIWNKDIQGMPFNKLVRLKNGASYKGRYVGENENGEAVYQVVKPHLSFKQKGKFVYINNASGVEDLAEGYVFVDASGNISESQENTTRKKVYFVSKKETNRFAQANIEDSAENKQISYTNIYDENNKPLRKKAEKVLWERTEEQLYEYIENYADKKIAEEKEKGFEFTDQDARYYHYLLNKAKKIYDYAVKLYNEDDKDFGESGASRTQKQSFFENAKSILELANKEVENFKKSGIEKQLQECEDEEKNLDAIMPLISQEEIIQGTHEQRSALYKWLKMIGVKVHNLSAEDFADKLDKFQNTADFHLAKSMQGDVYGFVYRGQIYINQDIAGSEVYVHEYSHIWIQSLKKLNPKLYVRGVELARQMPDYQALYNSVLASFEAETPTSEQMTKADEWVCEELLAAMMGKRGAERINQIAESGDTLAGLARRIKQWIKDAYDNLKSIMDSFTDKEIESLTVESFSDMMLNDLANLVAMESPSVNDEVKTIDAQKARMEDIKRRFHAYVGGVESGSLDTAYGLSRVQLKFIIKEIRKIQPQRGNTIPLSACREIYKQLLTASKTNFRQGNVKPETYTKPLMEAYCKLLTLFNNIESNNVELAQSKVDKTFNRAISGTKKQDIKRGGVMSYTYANAVMSLREQSDEELLDGTNKALTDNKRMELNGKFDKLAQEINALQAQLNNEAGESKMEIERKIREKQSSYNMLAVEELAITAQEERRKVAEAELQMSEHIKRINQLQEQIKQDQRSRHAIEQQTITNATQEASNKRSVIIINKRIKDAREDIRYIEYLMSVTSQEILEHNNKQLIACNAILEAGRSEYHAMVYKRAQEKAEFLAEVIPEVKTNVPKQTIIDSEGNAIEVEFVDNTKEKNGKIVDKGKDGEKRYNWFKSSLDSADYMVKKVSRNVANGMGKLFDFLIHDYNLQNEKFVVKMREHKNAFNKKISEIFNGEIKDYERLSFHLQNKTYDTTVITSRKEIDGNVIETQVRNRVSIGTAMYFYMVEKQEDGRVALKNAGVSQEFLDQIRNDFENNPAFVKYLEVANFMQFEYLPQQTPRYNKAYFEQFFINLPQVENYFPLRVEESSTASLLDTSTSEYQLNAKTIADALHARNHNSTIEFNETNTHINPVNIFVSHLNNMEHWVYMNKLQERVNWLLNSNTFQRELSRQGRDVRKTFNNAVVYMVSNTIDKSDVLNTFLSAVMLSKIGWKLMTALKQFTSYTLFGIYANNPYVRKRLALYILDKNVTERCKREFPTVLERIEDNTMGNDVLAISNNDTSKSYIWRISKRKAREVAIAPNKYIDGVTVSHGTLAVYDGMTEYYMKEKGMSKEEAELQARADAMNAFESTQQSSNRAYMSTMQRERTHSNAILSAFQNAAFAIGRRSIEAIRVIFNYGMDKDAIIALSKQRYIDSGFSESEAQEKAVQEMSDAVKGAYRCLLANGLGQLAFYGTSYLSLILAGYDEDDDEEAGLLPTWLKLLLHSTAGTWLSGYGFIGSGLSSLIDGYGINPYSLLTNIFDSVSDIIQKDIPEYAKYIKGDSKKSLGAIAATTVNHVLNCIPTPISIDTIYRIGVGLESMFDGVKEDDLGEFYIGLNNFLNTPPSVIKKMLKQVEGYKNDRATTEDERYINGYNFVIKMLEKSELL